MKKVCVFGASVTQGFYDELHGGWCDRLKQHVMKQEVLVYNLGISGDDTADLLQRIEPECMVRKPNVIVIALGGNDSQYLLENESFRIPIEQTKKNLEKIIEMAKTFTERVIVVGLTPVDEARINAVYVPELKRRYTNQDLKRYDAVLEEVTVKNGLRFIPTFDVLDADDLEEGLHPTVRGHEKLFGRILEYLEGDDLI